MNGVIHLMHEIQCPQNAKPVETGYTDIKSFVSFTSSIPDKKGFTIKHSKRASKTLFSMWSILGSIFWMVIHFQTEPNELFDLLIPASCKIGDFIHGCHHQKEKHSTKILANCIFTGERHELLLFIMIVGNVLFEILRLCVLSYYQRDWRSKSNSI